MKKNSYYDWSQTKGKEWLEKSANFLKVCMTLIGCRSPTIDHITGCASKACQMRFCLFYFDSDVFFSLDLEWSVAYKKLLYKKTACISRKQWNVIYSYVVVKKIRNQSKHRAFIHFPHSMLQDDGSHFMISSVSETRRSQKSAATNGCWVPLVGKMKKYLLNVTTGVAQTMEVNNPPPYFGGGHFVLCVLVLA